MVRKWSKIAASTVFGALVGAIAFWMFGREIGTSFYRDQAARRVGRDIIAGLPDGLHVALCGTGSPLPDPGRAGPCSLIVAGQHVFLVDAGEGSARNLARMGLAAGRIESVLITHFHSDHIDGLGPVMLMRWTGAAATKPLTVRGPTGVERVVAGFNAAYAFDFGYRSAHHGDRIAPPAGAGGNAEPFTLPAGPLAHRIIVDSDGIRITAFRVDHGPVQPAVGYRFDYKGRSVVLSGDTAPSASLDIAARGADLLVHEALQPHLVGALTEALAGQGLTNAAQITRDIVTYHSTPEQAADCARRAGVRILVLNHIVPPLPTSLLYSAFLGDAANHYAGPIVVGADGMLFSLPANSHSIGTRRLL